MWSARRRSALAAVVASLLAWDPLHVRAASSHVDVCLEWNAVALRANIIDHTGPDLPGSELSTTMGPPASARALAMLHLAMFEAYNCCEKKYESYFEHGGGDMLAAYEGIGCLDSQHVSSKSTEVAVAEAVFTVMAGVDDLSGLYDPATPSGAAILAMASDARNKVQCRNEMHASSVQTGVDVGREIGRLVLLSRVGDGYARGNSFRLPGEYMPTGEAGDHDVDPLNDHQGFFSPLAGDIDPFGMSTADLHDGYRAPMPACLANGEFDPDEPEYVDALRQVRDKGYFRGGEDGAVPTDDLTYVIANYWSCNGSPGTGTPPVLYNDMIRKIAIEADNDLHENCLLFALVNLAMANGAFSSWDSKYAFRLWRPIRGIRERKGLDGDKKWTPLGASRSNPWPDYDEHNFSPPFPAYTSGHATFGCAAFKTVANFYETFDVGFAYTSVEWNGETRDQFERTRPCLTREFADLKHAMAENAASRVFNGVHWAFDGVEGCLAGVELADFVFEQLFMPKPNGLYNAGRAALSNDGFDVGAAIEDIVENICAENCDSPDACLDDAPYSYPYVTTPSPVCEVV